MKIYLIRHGETTGDLEDRYGGDYDDHLSPRGYEQARELAGKLVSKNIDIIYHSPRIRARETADILAGKLGCRTEEVDTLRERNAYGVLTGMVKSDANKKHPKEVEKIEKDRIRHSVSGSEDYESFMERALKSLDGIFANNKHQTIAIITHGGVISTFIREYLKKGELKKLGDCSIIELDKVEDQLVLRTLDGAELQDR